MSKVGGVTPALQLALCYYWPAHKYIMNKALNIFLIMLLFALNHVSAFAQPVIKKQWQADWIGESYPSVPNSFIRFRHSVEIDTQPETLIAHIAADTKYWLYINGKLVIFEGQLKRGPTPKDTYFDEVDIAPWLQAGDNTIAILLWYWGREGFCHKSSGKAGLLFEAISKDMKILSNENWKIAPHPAYLQQSAPPYPNYRLPEFNVRYDARFDDGEWFAAAFDDSKWSKASAHGAGGAAPWNALWKRPVPMWYDSGLMPYVSTGVTKDEHRQSQHYIGKLPRNLTITSYLKVDAPAGLRINMYTDNYKGGSEYNVRSEYITKGGVQEFETPGYMNGHDVIYDIPIGIKVIELKYRETRYDAKVEGSFNSNDAFLDTLWKKSLYTMNVNMRDAIQDPDRERAQWWGDVVIILGQIFYSIDFQSGTAALQKAMSNLVEWQKADSVLFSPVPAGNWDKELPGQMLASIGAYGFGRYFDYTNDSAFMRYLYPALKKYMALWQIDSNGLVVHRAGGWDWHDWGNKIDAPLLDNAWYVMALRTAIRMADMSGDNMQATFYTQQLATVEKAFQKHFWQGNAFRSKGFDNGTDDRGNGLAVAAGLVTPAQWPHLKMLFDTVFNAGPYLEKYILEAYYLMGDGPAGLARMKQRYAGMVANAATTLWEGWEVGSGTYGGGSYNHGWSGGPLTLMNEYIAGISPATPGYQRLAIYPQLSGLHQVSATAPLPQGTASVNILQDDKQLTMRIDCSSLPAEIGIPVLADKAPYKAIYINGKKMKPGSKQLPLVTRFGQMQYFRYLHQSKKIVEIKAVW